MRRPWAPEAGHILPSLLTLVGNTPLVDASGMFPGLHASVAFKLEKYSAAGSIKDRVALHVVEQAEREGRLRAGGTLIESSSGNLGIALAFVGAIRGYSVIIIVDPKTSPQNVAIMRAYGAEVLVETEPDHTGNYHMTRIARARALECAIPGALWVNQTANPLNVEAHRTSTAAEILRETGGALDTCVLAVSTGGQVSGVAEALRATRPWVRVVAVDIEGSAIFRPAGHRYATPGMGLSWRPIILHEELLDAVYHVDDAACCSAAHYLARRGLLVGPSSGAVALVCTCLALGACTGQIVGVLSDSGERYLETVFSPDWLRIQGITLRSTPDQIVELARGLLPSRGGRAPREELPR